MQQTFLAALLADAFSMAARVSACPADKRSPDGNGQKMGATMPKDVTDRVVASDDLSSDPIALKGRLLRARELVVARGHGACGQREHAGDGARHAGLVPTLLGTLKEVTG